MKKLLLMIAFGATTLIFAQTEPTATWTTTPPSKLEVGKTYTFTAKYDAGNDGSGTDYTSKDNIQFSISEKADKKLLWKAGTNDPSTKNTHSGTAKKEWKIPELPSSASLPSGTTYVLRVGFQNSDNKWAKTTEYPIIIGGEATASDAVSFDGSEVTLKASQKLEIPIQYSSDTDIAVDGIKLTLWTITAPFSDVWHGLYSNKKVLPAGQNLTTTITINVPKTIKTDNLIWTSDEIASHNPNVNDDQYKAPIKNYYYQLRMVKGGDDSFTPELKNNQATLIITK